MDIWPCFFRTHPWISIYPCYVNVSHLFIWSPWNAHLTNSFRNITSLLNWTAMITRVISSSTNNPKRIHFQNKILYLRKHFLKINKLPWIYDYKACLLKRYFTIHSPWKTIDPSFWTNMNLLHSRMLVTCLVEIGPVLPPRNIQIIRNWQRLGCQASNSQLHVPKSLNTHVTVGGYI